MGKEDDKETNVFGGATKNISFGSIIKKENENGFLDALKEKGGESEEKKTVIDKVQEPMTGEEKETTVFSGKASLFIFSNDKKDWKENGKGEVRLNRNEEGRERIIMRAEGVQTVLLNSLLLSKENINKNGPNGVVLLLEFKGYPKVCLFRFSKEGICNSFINLIKGVSE
eukprot:GHVP01042543.1.p2 GENE.GHVP01042543.1~~GHVP01042543.1.p2  ORF type:complete len:170 (+),score=49.64 GHVP01042543.1:202-711(+)